jgi:hypothetical protein
MLTEVLAVVLLRAMLVALGVVALCVLGGWVIPFGLAAAEACCRLAEHRPAL